MRAIWLAVLAGGCGFHVGASSSPPDTGHLDPDAMEPDAPDAPAVCATWDPQHFEPCMVGTPKPPLTITAADSPWRYDTTLMGGVLRDNVGVVLMSPVVVMQPDNSLVAVLNVDALVVEPNATLAVVGEKPLLIASWSTIVMDGRIDAGSLTSEVDNTAGAHIDGSVRTGAGANPVGQCSGMTGSAGANAVSTGGSGAGGGGAHRGDGGDGATGDSATRPGGPGGTRMATPPPVLRGGCNGGAGGNAGTSGGLLPPATSASVAVGGVGGGAIELAARTSITMTGTINAGGAGGAGAPAGSGVGGGGGGAGGYLGLDAPMVTITGGRLAANGGGGGAPGCYAGDGNQGANAVGVSQAAGGAVGGGSSLAGAFGSVGATFDGANATGSDGCGGGGGGGGAGFIFVWSPAFVKQSPSISPTELP